MPTITPTISTPYAIQKPCQLTNNIHANFTNQLSCQLGNQLSCQLKGGEVGNGFVFYIRPNLKFFEYLGE